MWILLEFASLCTNWNREESIFIRVTTRKFPIRFSTVTIHGSHLALFPGLPRFWSLVCVSLPCIILNTLKNKNGGDLGIRLVCTASDRKQGRDLEVRLGICLRKRIKNCVPHQKLILPYRECTGFCMPKTSSNLYQSQSMWD